MALWVGLALVLVVGAWSLWQGLLKTTPGGRSGVAKDLNVLLITLDTTRADYLGCYGRASARTPNIDRLAREGTLFTRCTTCSPLTLPSHSSILTAVHPYVHGARRNGTYRLDEGKWTLWSIGFDQDDDDGKIIARLFGDNGDLVWTSAAEEEAK